MSQTLLFFIFFFAFQSLFAQNLVINPSFEKTQHCVSNADVGGYSNIPLLLLSQCEAWASFSSEGTADLYQPCGLWNMRSSYSSAAIKPKTGSNMAGFFLYENDPSEEYREYLHGKLIEPLKKGETYQVSFYVLLADACAYAISSFGVYFSRDSLYRLDSFYGVAPFLPQIKNKRGNFLKDKKNWTELNFEYKAKGGEQFLMIGNFETNEDSDTLVLLSTEKYFQKKAYYYLDDVCVSARNCPTEIILPKYNFKTMVYDAEDKKPIENAKISFYAQSDLSKISSETNEDGVSKTQMVQNQYVVFIKQDCYLPAMAFYDVPVIRKGDLLPEQLQYFPLTKMQNGAKIALEGENWKSLGSRKARNDEKLSWLFTKLDHWAIFLKENPKLKISLQVAVYFDYYKNEEKRLELQTHYEQDLVFLQNYFLEKGVKQSQFITRLVEITKENPAESVVVNGAVLGEFANRYEIEVLENECNKSKKVEVEKKNKFFSQMQKGEIFIFEKVNFSPDSPELKSSSYKELDQLVEVLVANPSIKIRINGHTDIGIENGSDDFLQQLSENRAKAVAQYLIKKGVKAENMAWEGFANRKPTADNNTAAGKAKNRRVEVEIME